MKVLLLFTSMTCLLVAAILAGRWGWFGIDPNPRLVDVWFAAAGIALAGAFLPWGRPFRRWFES
jgi:hypothetical protein